MVLIIITITGLGFLAQALYGRRNMRTINSLTYLLFYFVVTIILIESWNLEVLFFGLTAITIFTGLLLFLRGLKNDFN